MATASEIALGALRTALNGGRLYLFAGTVPATAEEALDMVDDHTQLVEMTESGDGVTGLTFEAPSGTGMVKAAGETWEGLIAFDGFESGPGTATATFYRFCSDGDDGRGEATDPRIQGTIGGPEAAMPMASAELTDNGTNTLGASYFSVTETPQ